MATQTAIDYGPTRLRLLEYDGSGRKVRVLGVTEVDLKIEAAGDDVEVDDLRAEAIADAVKDSGVSLDPSGMAFDAGNALFREFDLPFTKEEQVNKVVRFEAESHIPLDIDEVVMQHLVLRTTRERSHILAAALRKDDLLDRLDILDESGLDPMFVDMDVFALYHTLVATGVADEHPCQVIVNAQESSTSLLFLVEGKLFSVRSLRLGTHGIATNAAESKASDADVDTARAHDYEGRLKREIRRTMTTLPNLPELQAVRLTGSGSRIQGFQEAAAEAFGMQAERLDLLEYVDHKLSDEDAERYGPDIGVALGVAYKLNGLDLTLTDFRQDECAYTRKFDQVKSPLIVLSFLLFLVVALGCIDAFYQVKKVKREYQLLTADALAQLEQLLEDNEQARQIADASAFGPDRVNTIFRHINDLREQTAQQLGRSEQIPTLPSALHVWIEFSNLVFGAEETLGRLWVKKLDINVYGKNPQLRVSGVMESASKYSRLLQLFEEDPLFVEVKPGSAEGTNDGLTKFSETVLEIDLDELAAREVQA